VVSVWAAAPEAAAESGRKGAFGLWVGLVIVGICALAAGMLYGTAPAPAITPSPAPAEIAPEPPPPAAEKPQTPAAESPVVTPVFFANPFDGSEVFEFPPGTSEREARDAVADALLKRARERLKVPSGAREPARHSGAPAAIEEVRPRLAKRN
jgi:hypothetical protein